MGRRGKLVSWSAKGVRVGYGRHKKQVVKTGCAVILAALGALFCAVVAFTVWL